jgi:hypothetical protein
VGGRVSVRARAPVRECVATRRCSVDSCQSCHGRYDGRRDAPPQREEANARRRLRGPGQLPRDRRDQSDNPWPRQEALHRLRGPDESEYLLPTGPKRSRGPRPFLGPSPTIHRPIAWRTSTHDRRPTTDDPRPTTHDPRAARSYATSSTCPKYLAHPFRPDPKNVTSDKDKQVPHTYPMTNGSADAWHILGTY